MFRREKQLLNNQTETIAEAFSRTAEKYDAFANDHPHLTRMRNKVYDHICKYLPRGSSILELNAGTGTAAVYIMSFASGRLCASPLCAG